MNDNPAELRYPFFIRLLHWTMAAIVVTLIAVGWTMSGLPREAENRGFLYDLHKSFGVLILLLALLRVSARLRSRIPPLPPFTPYEKILAKLSHYLLYALLVIIPIMGILMVNGFGFEVPFFGLTLPRVFPLNRELAGLAKEVHEVLAYSLLGLVALHVAAVIKHWYIDRVNLLGRMW
jgi:cytochrome b561